MICFPALTFMRRLVSAIGSQICLCGVKKMKNKTYRLATALDVLLALLVFVAPVGAAVVLRRK